LCRIVFSHNNNDRHCDSITSRHAVLQVQYTNMQESLRCAEEAAAVATSECAGLVQVVQTLINQEARVRSSQAHRAHELREALQQTHAALRRAADKDRGTQDEVGGAACQWQ
jgi:hypothetical protein